MTLSPTLSKQRLHELLVAAQAQGADAADVVYASGVSLNYRVRNQRVEHVERAEGGEIGLRVFLGKKQVVVSSGDTSEEALKRLIDRAMEMVRVVPEDPFCGLASPEQQVDFIPEVESCDENADDDAILLARATEAEAAAMLIPGVSASEGADASYGRGHSLWMNTNGFYGENKDSMRSLAVSVLATCNGEMERDYDATQAVFAQDLKSPSLVGRLAGERAVKRLGGKRLPSCKLPVIFDPRESGSLLGHLASAINGASLARGVSFLKEQMGKSLFNDSMQVWDDPLRSRGMRSRSFDAEGIATRKRRIIEDGVLASWILDLRTARQLGLETTGHAVRSPSSIPHPSVSNFYLEPGSISPKDLLGSVKKGIYVTELIGDGVSMTTGDYSRGAVGYMIENGELTFPINEITIAGNLIDMFAHMVACDDLVFQYGIDAPTLMVEEMTIAGD